MNDMAEVIQVDASQIDGNNIHAHENYMRFQRK